jgi:hypothetical protein
MLLFWLLAAYVITRSPRSPISLTAVGAQVAAAAYLLSQGMQANAETIEEWSGWARPLVWGSIAAPTLWNWVTVLLLKEQESAEAERYTRLVGYPLGILFAAASIALIAAAYVDDWVFAWSTVRHLSPGEVTYSRIGMAHGVFYPWLMALLAGTTVGAAINVWLGTRFAPDSERRRRFAWLLVSAVLFIGGANVLGLVNWLTFGAIPTWIGHLALAAAMAVMAWNVAAYSVLLQGQVIKTDFLYFVTATTVICAVYSLLFLLFSPGYNFQLLSLAALTLTAAIISHALVDVGRRLLDRLFFGSEVQRLRSNLSSVVQSAALARDLGPLLVEAEVEIAEVTADHLARLTEQALRRLSNPSALADCALIAQLPYTLKAAVAGGNQSPSPPGAEGAVRGIDGATPLEQARALRETLTAAIERLKPSSDDQDLNTPAALQYHILREEYLQGLLNKQIMTRHAISEGTFHRNRRQAIGTLARELKNREGHLARRQIGVP